MTRARAWADHAIQAVVVAMFDLFARLLQHTPKEPW